MSKIFIENLKMQEFLDLFNSASDEEQQIIIESLEEPALEFSA